MGDQTIQIVNLSKMFQARDYTEHSSWYTHAKNLYVRATNAGLKAKIVALAMSLLNDCMVMFQPRDNIDEYIEAVICLANALRGDYLLDSNYIVEKSSLDAKEKIAEIFKSVLCNYPTVVDILYVDYYEKSVNVRPVVDFSILLLMSHPKYFGLDAVILAKVITQVFNKLEYFTDVELIVYNDLIELNIDEFPALSYLKTYFIGKGSYRNSPLIPRSTTSPRKMESPVRIKTITRIGNIGKGSYGAVGSTDIGVVKTQNVSMQSYIELSALQTYKHANIIELLSFHITSNIVELDMEKGIPLLSMLKQNPTMSEWEDVYLNSKSYVSPIPGAKRVNIILGIVSGLKYLHDHGVIHRDLKTDNIVIVNGVPKIIDFGLAYTICLSGKDSSQKQLAAGTIGMRPPDVILCTNDKYAFDFDIWSLGCVITEIEIGIQPFVTLENKPEITKDPGANGVLWCIAKIIGGTGIGTYNFPGTRLAAIPSTALREGILSMLSIDWWKRPNINSVETYLKEVLLIK